MNSNEATAERSEGPETGRQAESRRRRARILEAARACFGEEGFAGATVGRIALRAGVSNGLLYQFFRNKEHLFSVVLEELIRDWVRAMVPREDEAASAGEKLERMFRGSVAFCRDHPLLSGLVTQDQSLQLGRVSTAGADRIEPHRELVARLLREGVASGEFREDLDVRSAADLICQLQSDYSSRAYRSDAQFPADAALIDGAVAFIHAAVKAG